MSEGETDASDDAPVHETLITRDGAGIIVSVAESIHELLGWSPAQMIGEPSTKFIHPDDQSGAVSTWMEMVTTPGIPTQWHGRYQTVDGRWQWVRTVNISYLDDPDRGVVLTTMSAVEGEQVSIKEELRARTEMLDRLSDAVPVGIFQIDLDGHVTFTNERFHTILGVDVEATIETQFAAAFEEDRADMREALASVLADEPVDDIEIRLGHGAWSNQMPSETVPERICQVSLRPLTDAAGMVSGAVGCLSDVTDSVRLRRELELRASTDPLVGCLNRRAALEHLDLILAQQSPGAGTAVAFIDLDRFKWINDELGHGAGDFVLVTVAELLRSTVRERDEIGRVGGDEFLVMFPDVASHDRALELGARVADALRTEIYVEGHTIQLTASVGTVWTSTMETAASLIASADEAMYRSKQADDDTTGRRIECDNELAGSVAEPEPPGFRRIA